MWRAFRDTDAKKIQLPLIPVVVRGKMHQMLPFRSGLGRGRIYFASSGFAVLLQRNYIRWGEPPESFLFTYFSMGICTLLGSKTVVIAVIENFSADFIW